MQSSEAIRVIKERLNIVDIVRRYVDLKPNGPRFVAPCPFHQETKPSFSVNPDKGLFYCFGCQAAGDIFEFYSRINGLDFKECLEQLADEAGITIDYSQKKARTSKAEKDKQLSDKSRMLAMHELAVQHFRKCLHEASGAVCRAYMQKRILDPQIEEKFGLGWAPDSWHSLTDVLKKNRFDLDLAVSAGLVSKSDSGHYFDRFRGRLMFPIKNMSGQTIAFGGRIIEDKDEAKYINSQDTPIYKKKEHLYGLYQGRRSIGANGSAILTEGYMDVLTLNQFGFENSAGVLGTALTEEQIKRLSGFTSKLFLVFDGDKPGRKAALRSCEMLLGRGLDCKVILLPETEDIDSLLKSAGPEAFRQMLDQAESGLAYCVRVLREMAPRDAVEWARNFLTNVQVPELESSFASALATQLQISESSLREKICETRQTLRKVNKENSLNARDSQILIYAVRYPHRLQDLRNIGADLALKADFALSLWSLIEKWGPEDAFYHLDASQKEFWLEQRGPKAPPLNDGDFELSCLHTHLTAFYTANQKSSLRAALSENDNGNTFETQLEYLRALQETLGKEDEQS